MTAWICHYGLTKRHCGLTKRHCGLDPQSHTIGILNQVQNDSLGLPLRTYETSLRTYKTSSAISYNRDSESSSMVVLEILNQVQNKG